MKLYTHCKSCKSEFKVKSNAETRPDLQMEKGEEFKLNCLNCGKIDKVHVNDIKAESNKKGILIGITLGVLLSAVLWFFYGAIAAIAVVIPYIFRQQELNKVKAFNSYMIRRK